MKASELKNTPWTVVEQDTPQGITGIYEVEDYLGNVVAASITDRPTARAIASLPDTLKELEAVKAEFEKLQKHFTAKDLELDTVKAELEMSKYTGQSAVNELHKYKQETDEVVRTLNAERDELRAFVSRVANAKAIRSEDTDFLQKQAKQLLKAK